MKKTSIIIIALLISSSFLLSACTNQGVTNTPPKAPQNITETESPTMIPENDTQLMQKLDEEVNFDANLEQIEEELRDQ